VLLERDGDIGLARDTASIVIVTNAEGAVALEADAT